MHDIRKGEGSPPAEALTPALSQSEREPGGTQLSKREPGGVQLSQRGPGGIRLIVNGESHLLRVPRDAPLLNILRNDLELNAPKYGCGLGQCGACTVLVDGVEARACVIPVGGIESRHVTTLEGLGDERHPHPVQQAFIDCQAAQCGYCLNGMIMSTVALLQRNPDPRDEEARSALAHNLCRCGAHLEILQAVQRAAVLMRAP
jgi:nicotinate dehydrogenase subunit A